MSRLYEALTRRQREGGETAGVDWKDLKGEMPDTPPEPAGVADAPPSTEPAAEPGSHPGQSPAAPVDRQVRLLPHATDPVVVERYRRLRTKILHIRESRPFHSLMIASGSPQEGKTLTVINLAWSFALLSSFRVLAVDGDLRKGTMGEWLGADANQPGFSNLIEGSVTLMEAVSKSEGIPFEFIVRGNSAIPPAELLNAPALRAQIAAAGTHFDLVLVDSPPANLLADAHLLAASCDAVLLVARAFSTSGKAFDRVAQELHPSKVIGAILNAGQATRSHRQEYYFGEKS